MKYLCLVYHEEQKLAALSQPQMDGLVHACIGWVEELEKCGHHIFSAGLQSVRTATTVRHRDGTLSVSDGPFAETKEFLGGFTLINARDLNEAIQIAAKFPAARLGSMEVRPVLEPDGELTSALDQKIAAAIRRRENGVDPATQFKQEDMKMQDGLPGPSAITGTGLEVHPTPYERQLNDGGTIVKYMLLIYADERAWNETEREHCYQESTQLARDLNSSGQYLAANPLHSVSQATSVRVREGKRLVTDGPFAETREQLGGYFLIDARDLDEAIGIAARIPGARKGTVEIRPIIEIPGLPAGA